MTRISGTTRLLLLGALVLTAGTVGTGCVANTPIKRSALTLPPAPPTTSGRAVGRGHVQLYGGMTAADVEERDFSDVGDSALWVPRYQAFGGLRIGLGDYVDLGMKGIWAQDEWSERSTPGVPPLGHHERDAWGAGPTITTSIPLGSKAFMLGIVSEFLWTSIPYATWEKVSDPYGPADSTTWTPVDDPDKPLYRLTDEGRENFLFYNMAILLNYRFKDVPITVFGGNSFHSTLRNIGFDTQQRESSSTLEKGDPIFLLIGGMEADIAGPLNVMIEGYVPLNEVNDSSQVFGPGLELALGLKL